MWGRDSFAPARQHPWDQHRGRPRGQDEKEERSNGGRALAHVRIVWREFFVKPEGWSTDRRPTWVRTTASRRRTGSRSSEIASQCRLNLTNSTQVFSPSADSK